MRRGRAIALPFAGAEYVGPQLPVRVESVGPEFVANGQGMNPGDVFPPHAY